MRVYPTKDRLVRDPQTREPVPEQGLEVPQTQYWLRRLRDGDVTLDKPRARRAPKTQPSDDA